MLVSFIDDVDQGNSFSPSTLKPSQNTANEKDRWLPSGVRKHIRSIEPGADVQNLPPVVVKYLRDQELVHFPNRGPNMGSLVLNSVGLQVRSNNIKRLEGKV